MLSAQASSSLVLESGDEVLVPKTWKRKSLGLLTPEVVDTGQATALDMMRDYR